VVVDVGMHRVDDRETLLRLFGEDEKRLAALEKKGFTLAGDVHPLEARERAGWLSPVPGGVGPLTIAMLLKNTLDSARRFASLD
jgi:methylenetetrahydrofolate dehydrogenase (NADP+)/methenyltetrahydrofolate cyclohydrolase